MPYALTAEQERFRDDARRFVAEHVAPVASELDRRGEHPAELLDRIADEGWAGLLLPEAVGGLGRGHVELALLAEALSAELMSLPSILSSHWNASVLLERFGTEEQRERLPAMARYETVGAFAVTEERAGSDTENIGTTAEKSGDEWVLNGTKRWVTNLPHSDVVLTYARTGPRTDAEAGVSAFLVPADEFEIERNWEKLGTRCAETCEASLSDVRVATEDLVGTEGRALAERGEVHTGINGPARGVGLARAALDATASYAREREQFGHPIGEFQGLRWKVAEMAERVETARLLTLRAADLIDRDEPSGAAFSLAKVHASEAATANASDAIDLHGGVGYTTERDVERVLRDAKLLSISGGPNAGHRDRIAASVLDEE